MCLHKCVDFGLPIRWFLDVMYIALHITKEDKIWCIHNFLDLKIMVLIGGSDYPVTAMLMKKHPLVKIIPSVLVILHKTQTCLFFTTQILSYVLHHRYTTEVFIHTKAMVFFWFCDVENMKGSFGLWDCLFSFLEKERREKSIMKQLLRIDQNLSMKAKE